MHVCTYVCVCVCVCICLKMPEEGVKTPKARVTGSYKPPNMDAANQTGSLK